MSVIGLRRTRAGSTRKEGDFLTAQSDDVESFCFIYTVRAGMGAEYDRLHERVWPVAEAELRRDGWTRYEIYRRAGLVITLGSRRRDACAGTTPPDEVEPLSRWREAVRSCLDSYEDADGEPLYAHPVYSLQTEVTRVKEDQ